MEGNGEKKKMKKSKRIVLIILATVLALILSIVLFFVIGGKILTDNGVKLVNGNWTVTASTENYDETSGRKDAFGKVVKVDSSKGANSVEIVYYLNGTAVSDTVKMNVSGAPADGIPTGLTFQRAKAFAYWKRVTENVYYTSSGVLRKESEEKYVSQAQLNGTYSVEQSETDGRASLDISLLKIENDVVTVAWDGGEGTANLVYSENVDAAGFAFTLRERRNISQLSLKRAKVT